MKLYVPEIGDTIQLLEDWTFDLYAEERNKTVIIHCGKGFERYKIIDEDLIQMKPEQNYEINYPDSNDFRKMFGGLDYLAYHQAKEQAMKDSESYQRYLKAHFAWQAEVDAKGVEKIEITLPKGTDLKVDRIYIRKGISEYSSISFFILGFPKIETTSYWGTKTKRNLRFWAKLNDCNKIEFVKVEK